MTEAEKEHVASMRQQLARAERRLEIAERALREYADRAAWYTGKAAGHDLEVLFDSFDAGRHGWEHAENALKEMEEMK